MKLIHNALTFDIEFLENTVNVIVVENKRYLRELIKELCDATQGISTRYVLSNELKELGIKDNVTVINNVFDIDVNDKRILSKLYKRIGEINNTCHYENWSEIRSKLCAYLYDLIDDETLPLSFNDDIDIADILKIAGVKIDFQDQSVLDSVLTYISVCAEFRLANIIVGVCWSRIFDESELNAIKNTCFDNKIHLLLFDSEKLLLSDMKTYVVDSDLCEIY